MSKIDRRIVRTRKLLRDALMALILENGYESVTVQQITDRANLGRATFYLHYKDKEELLVMSLESLFDELVETMGPPAISYELTGVPVLVVFEHAQENSDLYRVLLSGEGSAKLYQRIQGYVAKEALRRFFPLLPEKRPFSDELLSNYLAGSLLTLLAWWLENELPHSPTYMTNAYRQLIFLGLGNLMEMPPPAFMNPSFPNKE